MNNRRDFLKMSTAGLCGLSAMPSLFAANSANGTTPRFIFLRKSNGTSPEWLIPPSLKKKVSGGGSFDIDLDGHDLPGWMDALSKHKKNLTILQGLSAKMCTMGHSTYQSPLAVCKAAERPDTIKRASVDFELAKLFPSAFEHIEVTCGKNQKGVVRGMSSIGPQQPNFAFASPKSAFENLFGLASTNKKTQINNRLNNDMFDFISKNIKPKNKSINNRRERTKLANYADSVDALIKREAKLVSMSAQIKKYAPALNSDIMMDKYTTTEQQQAFVDIILSSCYAGLSNIITFTLDNLETKYTGLFPGKTIELHEVGHGKDTKGISAETVRTTLRTHHMSLVDSLVTGLKKMPEGKGSMFDNTIIMYLPENGETHHSTGTHVPFIVLAGDKVKLDIHGRYIQLPEYDTAGHKTLGNWYTTILNAYGNPIKHYGDFDVALTIDQAGPIKQFLG
jgi:hypothetical protein